ncbi:MAG: hypothetical protein AB1458_12075 [Bacteroidota bacterium]
MALTKEEKEYVERLEMLRQSLKEQGKEIALPMLLDLASGFAGWYIGRKMGRASLLAGLAAFTLGKFHSLHETIAREQKYYSKLDDDDNRPALSGINPLFKDESRVYHGESPAVAFGFGLMLGGAFAQSDTVEGLGEGAERKPFSEIVSDLKYRLYLDKFFKDETKQEESVQQGEQQKAISGLEEVDIFLAEKSGLNPQKLDEIEQQVEQAAIEFEKKPEKENKGSIGEIPYAQDEEEGDLDGSERIY